MCAWWHFVVVRGKSGNIWSHFTNELYQNWEREKRRGRWKIWWEKGKRFFFLFNLLSTTELDGRFLSCWFAIRTHTHILTYLPQSFSLFVRFLEEKWRARCVRNIHSHASQLRFAHSKPFIHLCTLSLHFFPCLSISIIIFSMIVSDIIQYPPNNFSPHVRYMTVPAERKLLKLIPLCMHTRSHISCISRTEIYDALI